MSKSRVVEIHPHPEGFIPRLGCPVRILAGSRHGETGTVIKVVDHREAWKSLELGTYLELVKAARARLGDRWPDLWYIAKVQLADGTVELGDDEEFEILDKLQTRGKRYRSGA